MRIRFSLYLREREAQNQGVNDWAKSFDRLIKKRLPGERLPVTGNVLKSFLSVQNKKDLN